jgi:CreA protein
MTSRGVTIDVGTRLRRLSSLWGWRPRVGKLRRVLGQSRSRRLWRLRKPPGVLFCGVRVVRGLIVLSTLIAPAKAADEPDLIFRRSTVFKLLTPNDKLATYGLDDPEVEGVACHFTVPERGGVKGWLGVAEEVSDISLACRQIGPIRFKAKFEQGEDVFRKRRSLFFKKMQIVRGCDAKRNVLVYMVYSDRLIEGSPKNSTSSVPIMPWGQNDQIQKCADFLEK